MIAKSATRLDYILYRFRTNLLSFWHCFILKYLTGKRKVIFMVKLYCSQELNRTTLTLVLFCIKYIPRTEILTHRISYLLKEIVFPYCVRARWQLVYRARWAGDGSWEHSPFRQPYPSDLCPSVCPSDSHTRWLQRFRGLGASSVSKRPSFPLRPMVASYGLAHCYTVNSGLTPTICLHSTQHLLWSCWKNYICLL